MVTFLVLRSVLFGEFHTIALHIYRVLRVFAWVSEKKTVGTCYDQPPCTGGDLGVTLLIMD